MVIDDVPWYEGGIRFECQGCGACCLTHGEHAYVYLNDRDAGRIAEHLDLERIEFLSLFCEHQEGEWSYLRNDQVDCPLLDAAGRCRAYPVRPMQCVTWPFWTENLEERATWEGPISEVCPGIGKGRIYSREEIARLAAERDRWMED
jgi:Fe-S-cluster containining protein